MLCKNVLNKFNYVVNGKTLENSLSIQDSIQLEFWISSVWFLFTKDLLGTFFKTTSIKGI